jgi:hypothetical protein
LRRYELLDFDTVVERPCERLVVDDRNAVLAIGASESVIGLNTKLKQPGASRLSLPRLKRDPDKMGIIAALAGTRFSGKPSLL